MADLTRDSGGYQRTAVIEYSVFSDKQGHPSDYPYFQSPPIYERCTANILGADEEQGSTPDEGLSHCFNCGSAYHTVSSCLVPHNMELIMLSRQMYNFFKPVRFPEPMTVSAATEFVNQRRQWLASFEPGQVRGPKLREALGLRDTDVGSELPWLKNMADWGYPIGWFSEEDPREQVLQRIDNLFAEPLDLEDGDHSLAIFGEDAVEAFDVGIRHFHSSSHEEINKSQCLRDSSIVRRDRTKQVDMERGRRWARYPSTYFSSDLLPIYNGARLPPIFPTTSSTFTSERHLLWERILDKVDRCPAREVRALHDAGKVPEHVPPPPTSLPPPLPPHGPVARADDVPKDVESDMELSDSDC
jgi:zinc finger CCHC domain-containing protein 8